MREHYCNNCERVLENNARHTEDYQRQITQLSREVTRQAGIADEGEHKGKWFYEISIWDLAGEHQAGPPFQFGPFNSEDEACDFGRAKTKEVCHFVEEHMTGAISGRYLDMKNGGIMRPWEEQ